MNIKIENLTVEIQNKEILREINLEISDGETLLILGPNGHGKSTLLKTLMRHYDTKINNGKISINNKCINNYYTNEIVNEFKVYFAIQNPIEIPGLSMMELLRNEASLQNENINIIDLFKIINNKMKNLQMDPKLLDRSINNNFSGGEKKKSEILQMQIMNPNVILLDEIDSGLDVDAIDLIGNVLKEQQKDKKIIIYISHNERLLNRIPPTKTILIMNGKIIEIGGIELAQKINKIGYKKYADEIGIKLENNDDDFLKNTSKGYSCNGK